MQVHSLLFILTHEYTFVTAAVLVFLLLVIFEQIAKKINLKFFKFRKSGIHTQKNTKSKNPNVLVRAYEKSDEEMVAQFSVELNSSHGVAKTRLSIIERLAYYERYPNIAPYILVAELDGQRVGYASLQVVLIGTSNTFVYLTDFYVIELVRRSGVGTKLFDACLSKANELGHMTVQWDVQKDNRTAAAFYAAQGAVWIQLRMMAANVDRVGQPMSKGSPAIPTT